MPPRQRPPSQPAQLAAHHRRLPDGPHTFEVRATDAAANTDPTPASAQLHGRHRRPRHPDRLRPHRRRPTTHADLRLLLGRAGRELRVPARRRPPSQPCSSPVTYTRRSPTAPHASRSGPPTPPPTPTRPRPARSFTVDTGRPETTIDSGPTGPTNDPTPTFGFSSDEPGASFECRLDGRPPSPPAASPHHRRSLTDGPHTFEVRATDAAANTDPTPAARSFTVDTAAPETTIDSGPSGPTNDATPTFGFSSDDPGRELRVPPRLEPGGRLSALQLAAALQLADRRPPHASRSGPPTRPATPTRPRPRAASRSTPPPPRPTIDSGPSGPTNDATPTFGFSSDDPGASFECRLDGGAFAACSSPQPYSSLTDGPHTFEVRATDAAGNTDPTPAAPASRSTPRLLRHRGPVWCRTSRGRS